MATEDADACSRDINPQVLRDVVEVVEGTPEVRAYEVPDSTFHEIAAHNQGVGLDGEGGPAALLLAKVHTK